MSLKCKSCEHRFFQVGREVHSTCAITKEHVWSYVQLDTLSKKCPFSESNKKEIEKEQRENAEVKQAQQQEEDLKEAEQVATENNQQQQQQPTQEEEKEISVATPQAQNTQNLNQILNTIKKSIPHQPQQFVRKKWRTDMENKTLLDELNEILKKVKPHIPDYAREVHSNGRNLKWLKKNFGNKPETPERMKELLNMPINHLTKVKWHMEYYFNFSEKLEEQNGADTTIIGNPQIQLSPIGKTQCVFDGSSGIELPNINFSTRNFTIEAIW